MCLIRDFEVKVSKTEVVAAALPMQEHWLPLSNLDLLLPPVDFGVFFCYNYKPIELSCGHVVGLLKKALAQTLVAYYAFSGELVKNSAGEPELLCNNSGVDFVEAYADIELEDLNLYNPDESIEGKLVPKRKRGVIAVQATQLKHGGLVVACTFAHQVADAYSANMFLISWAEMAQSKPLSQPPSFRRSLLLPRRPGGYHISVDNMYVPLSALPPPEDQPQDDDQAAVSRIYYIKAEQVNELQELANMGNCTSKESRRTKLEAFCAFLWKMIVSAKDFGGDNRCRLGIVVDGRNRLMDGDEKEAKLIASYFGNVLSIPFGEKRIEELKEKPLNWVANEVHEFLKSAVTKEHFLGLIDWAEEHRPEMALAKIYATRVTEEEPAVVVSSGQYFPVRQMDFGWGSPVFGSYHFPWGGKSGYVMPMPSPKGNGDWIVYMHLLQRQLELIEINAAHATQVKHGGVVVACTFAHRVADAYSANMFLVSWAEMAQSKPLSLPASFHRSLLLPRWPGGYHISVDNMYVSMSALPPAEDQPQDDDQAAISRIYYIKADQVNELQELANMGNCTSKENRRTKLEAFCAFIWKTIVSEKDFGGDNYCRLGIVVDGRNRLIDGDEKEAKLIASYFGNVLSIPFGEKKIEELKEKPLNWVANEVHEFLKTAVTKEHFLGLIDWVEEHRPEMALAKIYASTVTEEEPAIVVSSGQHFPVKKIDFGWGSPVFGSYHFPWGGKSGYVMPMPSPKGNGDWIVYMHLLKGQLELIETNAANTFSPLTSDYLFALA